MSQPGGKKGGGKAAAAKKVVAPEEPNVDRTTPAPSKVIDDAKDETSSIGDKKEVAKGTDTEAPTPKPQSAGATTRDGAQKLLNLAMKGEWVPIENTMKQLEKAVAAATDEINTTPLAGVMDPVSGGIFSLFSLFFIYFLIIVVN